MLAGVFAAAVVGDQVGFLLGRKAGPSLFNRPNSRLFKQAHVEKAQGFFDRHGSKAIVMARFVPVVRTFCPVVAGVGRMKYSTFVRFNVIGAFFWAVGVTLLGYFLGNISFIKDNLEIALVLVVRCRSSRSCSRSSVPAPERERCRLTPGEPVREPRLTPPTVIG